MSTDEKSYFVFMSHPHWDDMRVEQVISRDAITNIMSSVYEELGDSIDELSVHIVHGIPVEVKLDRHGLVVTLGEEKYLAGIDG